MNVLPRQLKWLEFILPAVLAILVFALTFPSFDLTFGPGIDPPLSFAFNHLFEFDLDTGRRIIFPHGPLAFFLYPLQENIVIAVLVQALLVLSVVLNAIELSRPAKNFKWAVAFAASLVICGISGFTHLLLANILLLFLNHHNTQKRFFKYTAFFLTAFAFYVKSYVAVISGIICFSFLVAEFYRVRNIRVIILDAILIWILIAGFWLLMYGSMSGFFGYIRGLSELGRDNSSAASYYPANNWWLLGFFLLLVFLLPFVNRSRRSIYFGILVTLSVFAAWKHGMAREDYFHVKGLLWYIIIVLILFVLFIRKHILANSLLALIAIYLLYANLPNSINYEKEKIKIAGFGNFFGFFSNYETLKASAREKTDQSVQHKKLKPGLRSMIGNNTVDVYPWDYSMIYANKFKWQPRVVIQSYAAYTSWLDQQNADHFESQQAADFIVWEMDKFSAEGLQDGLNSIDNRYQLNDEPKTILAILKNYRPVERDGNYLVLKRRSHPVETTITTGVKRDFSMGRWMEGPGRSRSEVVRLRINFRKTLLQRLKSLFYKDEQYWIYLKLTDGTIRKFRIVPKNAEDGIWIKPLVTRPGGNVSVDEVEKIYVTASNLNILDTQFSYQWEFIDFAREDYVKRFFVKNENNKAQVAFSDVFDFSELTSTQCGKGTSEIADGGYSPAFSIPLSELPEGDLEIYGSCWIRADKYSFSNGLHLVTAVHDESGNKLWNGPPLDNQLIDRHQWIFVNNEMRIKNNGTPGEVLSVYFWNASKIPVCIDNLQLRISDN